MFRRAALLAAAAAAAVATPALAASRGLDAAGCTRVPKPPSKPDGGRKAPKDGLDSGKRYDLIVQTNCGSFRIRLSVRISPRTTASFVSLARSRFFDRTIFHRIIPGFVIQGGDPTGTGTGGPGYKTVDPPPSSTLYRKYLVATAKTPTEPAGTSGSQFFVVTSPNVQLPADYAVLGTVYVGRKVVDRIGRLGDPATERPTQPVVIEKTSVRVS